MAALFARSVSPAKTAKGTEYHLIHWHQAGRVDISVRENGRFVTIKGVTVEEHRWFYEVL